MKRIHNPERLSQCILHTAVLAFIVTGCAAGRDVIDVRVPNMPSNPPQGNPVTISRVSDRRVFEIKPTTHSTPSLKNKKEIGDKAITVRAIARKSGGFGNELGDIVLPEGRSVELLVEEAIARAFRESGYRVVTKDDPDFPSATPIEVDVEKFWTWFNPGMWTIRLEFESRIRMKGNIPPLENGEFVFVEAGHNAGAATKSAWLETWRRGLEVLVQRTRETLARGKSTQL
ncbi:MAG: YajG family lipoprotein [Verrucomicrobia subdivision 3 bacterium]|nr:YajG family lipoprotein [Limisphaerales bacterium]